MNVDKIPEAHAFSAGAELWVIKNDPATPWWPQLDFATKYLLSENYFRIEKELPTELLNIIEATSLDTKINAKLQNYVLLGSEDHFLNRWILLWNHASESFIADSILDLSAQMKFSTVRLFSNSKNILQYLETRPSASSLSISYIENT